MIIIDQIKQGINIILKPSSVKSMDIFSAMKFYWFIGIIFFIINLSLQLLSGASTSAVTSISSILNIPVTGSSITIFILITGIASFILAPILALVSAFIINIIGRAVGGFKNNLQETYSALIFAAIPGLLLTWLAPVPILGLFIGLIVVIWEIYLLLVILSRLQGTSILSTILTLIIALVVIVVIAFILAILAFGSTLGLF